MSLIWPQRVRADIHPLGRLARVVHWSAAALAGLLAFAAGWGVIDGNTDNLAFVLMLIALLLLGGRAVRFVLAGE